MKSAFAPLYLQVGQLKVAFLAFFAFYFPGWEEYTESIRAVRGAGAAVIRAFRVRVPGSAHEPVVAPEEDYLQHLLTSIREASSEADRVVVSMHSHFGLECADVVDPARRLLAHLAVEAGADLVLGHGPHTTNAIEYYRGGFIAHSLGNFYCHVPLEAVRYTYPDSRDYLPRYLANQAYWEAFLLEADLAEGPPRELFLHPFEVLQVGHPNQGMPVAGDDALTARTLERMVEHSTGMGVGFQVVGRSIRVFPEEPQIQSSFKMVG